MRIVGNPLKAFVIGLAIVLVLTIVSAIEPTKTANSIAHILSQTRKFSLRTTVTPTNTPWKTYIDEKHGFSFQFPDYWVNKSEEYAEPREPSGISVTPIEVPNCTTADDYFQKEILPSSVNIRKAPIANSPLDGFIIKEGHLDYLTPGPEAYIINCPYVIRLGFNPTGIRDGEDVFDEIISSFKTWKPSE